METINCIAIDDEPLALEVLEDYANQLTNVEMLQTFTDPLAALVFVKNNEVDLVFLDIEMPQINGLKLSELLPSSCSVAFVTAYDQHAIKSYDLEVIDYLLKPVSLERFLKTINKVIDRRSPLIRTKGKTDNQVANSDTIFVRSDKKIMQLTINNIVYVEGLKDYVTIHMTDSKVVIRESLKNVLLMLAPHDFIRVHKSYIVAVHSVKAMEGNQLHLMDRKVPVGGSYKVELLKAMQQRLLGKR